MFSIYMHVHHVYWVTPGIRIGRNVPLDQSEACDLSYIRTRIRAYGLVTQA